jgi:hypothetical protein
LSGAADGVGKFSEVWWGELDLELLLVIFLLLQNFLILVFDMHGMI